MNNEEYSKACTEVVTVLENIPKEYFEKIPYEKICFYRYKMDINYKYTYDEEYRNLSDYAVAILMNLYRDYWVSEEKRNDIIAKENEERELYEQLKREEYPNDTLFEKNKRKYEETSSEEQKKCEKMVKYKELKWYQKIFNKIINIFAKREEQ